MGKWAKVALGGFMRLFIISALALLLSLSVAHGADVPLIQDSQFKVGNFWVWKIGNKEGIFSREKYTVTMKRGDLVEFEMSTAYGSQSLFHLHHRFTVKLKDCFLSYPNENIHRDFTIKLTRFEHGQWGQTYQMHARAFEEKFNCNGHDYQSHSRFQTQYRQFPNVLGFKQVNLKDPLDQLNGWYAMSGELAGVMIEKTFNEGTESEFLSVLSEWRVD